MLMDYTINFNPLLVFGREMGETMRLKLFGFRNFVVSTKIDKVYPIQAKLQKHQNFSINNKLKSIDMYIIYSNML